MAVRPKNRWCFMPWAMVGIQPREDRSGLKPFAHRSKRRNSRSGIEYMGFTNICCKFSKFFLKSHLREK
jgi:hypothetical protein